MQYFLTAVVLIFFIGYGNQFVHAAKQDFSSPSELSNPLGSDENMRDPNYVIGKIINSVLGVVGTIALVMFIYGGFLWMTSGGGDGVKKGKETIVWATFGLVIIFMAYSIVNFVIGNILLGKPV